MTMGQSIGQIAQHPGEEQSEGEIAPGIWTTLFAQQNGKHRNHCDQRQDNEKGVVVLEGTKGCAGIGNVHEVEPAADNLEVGVWIDVSQDPIFCDLIERVKGEGER